MVFTNSLIARIGDFLRLGELRAQSTTMASSAVVVSAACACLLHALAAAQPDAARHSDEDDSNLEPEGPPALPFLKARDPGPASRRPRHPNEMIFPLIYNQAHVNSMFKFDENWYTWRSRRRADGSRDLRYYVCADEPKRCDDIGWERTDAVPQCAVQIDSLAADRACLRPFGAEPRDSGACDAADQMKVGDMVRACGPRVRSLWRFVRARRRPAAAAKPADVNSLVCDDEDECFITIEYRIHHDRITFSVHEPTRGQTFKSTLKREAGAEAEAVTMTATEDRVPRTAKRTRSEHPAAGRGRKFRMRPRADRVEGKGVAKERDESGYSRRLNTVKLREPVSEDTSE